MDRTRVIVLTATRLASSPPPTLLLGIRPWIFLRRWNWQTWEQWSVLGDRQQKATFSELELMVFVPSRLATFLCSISFHCLIPSWGKCQYLHFADEENETQKGHAKCPSHGALSGEWSLNLGFLTLCLIVWTTGNISLASSFFSSEPQYNTYWSAYQHLFLDLLRSDLTKPVTFLSCREYLHLPLRTHPWKTPSEFAVASLSFSWEELNRPEHVQGLQYFWGRWRSPGRGCVNKGSYNSAFRVTGTQCLVFCLLIIPWSIWLVSDIEILQHPVNKEPLCFFPNRIGPVTPVTERSLVSLVSICSDTVPAGPYSARTIAARCHQDHEPAQLQASMKPRGLTPSWRMAWMFNLNLGSFWPI